MMADAGPIGSEKGGDGMATAVLAMALLVAILVIDRLAR
jgi:hypothetical protein